MPPLKRHINHWKYTVACCYHDNLVYKKIDDPGKFDLDDPETRFLLSLRSVTSHMAFVNGHETWAMSDLTTSFSSFMDRVRKREMQSIFAEEGRTANSMYKITSLPEGYAGCQATRRENHWVRRRNVESR